MEARERRALANDVRAAMADEKDFRRYLEALRPRRPQLPDDDGGGDG
jgi:hypothetical protein